MLNYSLLRYDWLIVHSLRLTLRDHSWLRLHKTRYYLNKRSVKCKMQYNYRNNNNIILNTRTFPSHLSFFLSIYLNFFYFIYLFFSFHVLFLISQYVCDVHTPSLSFVVACWARDPVEEVHLCSS